MVTASTLCHNIRRSAQILGGLQGRIFHAQLQERKDNCWAKSKSLPFLGYRLVHKQLSAIG